MFLRIALGLLLGSLMEISSSKKYWIVFSGSVSMSALFAVDSSTYGNLYGIMAAVEVRVGFFIAAYVRLMKERYGV